MDEKEVEEAEQAGSQLEEEVIQDREVKPKKQKKKAFLVIGIVVFLLIIATGAFTLINLQKAGTFVKDISAQDAKLLDRETNASSMTAKLSYNDFIAETNMIIDGRNKLLGQVENEKILLFGNKIDDLKSNLAGENENIRAEQLAHLKSELSQFEKKDNIAMGDFISLTNTDSNLTWQETFDKLDTNISNRDKMISDIKEMNMLSYTTQISGYIDLLNSENKMVRSYSQLEHASFNWYVDAKEFIADPYFLDYSTVQDDKKEVASDFTQFEKDYKALLDKDKAFWITVNDLMPSRDLQIALTDFYNKAHNDFKSFLT